MGPGTDGGERPSLSRERVPVMPELAVELERTVSRMGVDGADQARASVLDPHPGIGQRLFTVSGIPDALVGQHRSRVVNHDQPHLSIAEAGTDGVVAFLGGLCRYETIR